MLTTGTTANGATWRFPVDPPPMLYRDTGLRDFCDGLARAPDKPRAVVRVRRLQGARKMILFEIVANTLTAIMAVILTRSSLMRGIPLPTRGIPPLLAPVKE